MAGSWVACDVLSNPHPEQPLDSNASGEAVELSPVPVRRGLRRELAVHHSICCSHHTAWDFRGSATPVPHFPISKGAGEGPVQGLGQGWHRAGVSWRSLSMSPGIARCVTFH